jgi:hypothetical protein
LRKPDDTTKPPRKQRHYLRLIKPPTAAPVQPSMFSVAEWASINQAYARAKAALSSRILAERDLAEHLRAGRLNAAARTVARGDEGRDVFSLLPPAFWRGLTLQEGLTPDPAGMPVDSGKVRVTARDAEAAKTIAQARRWWFFIARRDLDKLYPVGGGEEQQAPQPGRKRGRPPTHNWHEIVAAELIKRAKAGEPDPTAPQMIEYVEDELLPRKFSPGLKEMQNLLRRLLLSKPLRV